MFEFTLCGSNKTPILDNIYTKIKPQIDKLQGLVIKQESKQVSICLAVENKYEMLVKQQILELVSDEIILEYKFDFLKNHIKISINNSLCINAFIKALVVFDRQTDKDIIKKNLILQNKLNVDSFYYFRLGKLKKRWSDIAEIVNENIPIMLQNNSISELTKCFVDETMKEVEELHLIIQNKKIQIEIDNELSDLEFDVSAEYLESLLTEIISISPQKIVIHGDIEKVPELKTALDNFFDGSIYVIK